MKKWTGGTAILILAALLALRYALLPSATTTAATPSKRSHLLLSLPGLDDLFPTNSSPPTPTSQLLWPHIRPLLLRSDALPATADGVREASAAYLDLIRSPAPPPSPTDEIEITNRSCPFSVAATNPNATNLHIPCGLVPDSAITFLGVPTGRNGSGSFFIDLLGSGAAPPVVLRCNVSLGGDDPASGPAVAQNARRPDGGWGEWEQCPGHGPAAAAANSKGKKTSAALNFWSGSNPKTDEFSAVDGLVRCNEQSGEAVVQESGNGTQSPTSRSGIGFPLTEGHPFAATLWVGMEGFHMTVNGRHETSFAYRERLDPWSVSEVRVEGDLDLLSCIANGLPVSQDIDLAYVETLKAPLVKKRRVFLLVGVFSTSNNFNRRMALRRSWMQYEAVRSGVVVVRFLTGLHKSNQVNLELWREAEMYGDIQLMPFVDYYSLITLKTIGVCILGTKILPAKFIMKTDDDAFVRIDEVLSILKRNVSHGLLYGLISYDSSPHRDKDSKWYISEEEWPHDKYPPWAHGPGYIISRDVAKFIVRGHHERYLQLFKLEDVAMGIWIEEFKKSGEEVYYVNDDRFHNVGCETNYVLAHYQGPRTVLCLWEKLQKEHEPICCE